MPRRLLAGVTESRFRDNKWRFRTLLGVKARFAAASDSCHGRAKTPPFSRQANPGGLPLDTATGEWLHIVGV